MENQSWYFTKEQLENSPSRKAGVDAVRELSFRQQAANFIQDMGQRLLVSQLCINTAIVYEHRFYTNFSFMDVHRNNVAVAALFLAAKVEEQPRKLEQVIKVAHSCLHKDLPPLDVKSQAYSERMNEIVFHENLLLQTLGFVLAIEHPHTYVVKVCQLVKASKDLAQTSYIMATTSLHMTTMCLMYKPTLVACVCIHLACKWSNYRIEPCSEGKDWFFYVDKTVTMDTIEKVTQEYISILEKSPHRFKKKFTKELVLNDAAFGYHGPNSNLAEHKATGSSHHSRPSTSSEGSSTKRESSPPNYDFGAAFEDKRSQESPSGDKAPSASAQSSQPAPPEARKERVKPPLAVKTEPHHHHVKPKHRLPAPETKSNNVPPANSTLPTSKYPVKVEVKVESAQESPVVKPKVKEPVPEVLPPAPVPLPPAPILPLPQVPRELSPIKDVKTNGSKEGQAVESKPHENNVPSKRSSEGKHEKREKHRKHSSKDRSMPTNHSTGIKVKIRKDVINLPDAAAQPKMPLKIKLPRPPMPEALPPPPPSHQETPPAPIPSLKLVLTKDKSGSGSYSMSQHKNEREKKRGHPDGHKNSHEGPPPSKYHRSDHGGTPKTHHVDGHKTHKVHSRHRSEQHAPNSSRPDGTFQQNYSNPGYQNYNRYQMTPPPPLPKVRGNMPAGRTNPPLPPPLPPPPPPPPE